MNTKLIISLVAGLILTLSTGCTKIRPQITEAEPNASARSGQDSNANREGNEVTAPPGTLPVPPADRPTLGQTDDASDDTAHGTGGSTGEGTDDEGHGHAGDQADAPSGAPDQTDDSADASDDQRGPAPSDAREGDARDDNGRVVIRPGQPAPQPEPTPAPAPIAGPPGPPAPAPPVVEEPPAPAVQALRDGEYELRELRLTVGSSVYVFDGNSTEVAEGGRSESVARTSRLRVPVIITLGDVNSGNIEAAVQYKTIALSRGRVRLHNGPRARREETSQNEATEAVAIRAAGYLDRTSRTTLEVSAESNGNIIFQYNRRIGRKSITVRAVYGL